MHRNHVCTRWVQTQCTVSPNSVHEEFKLSTQCHHLPSTVHPPPMPPASPGHLTIAPPSLPSPFPVASRPRPTPASPAHLTITLPSSPSPLPVAGCPRPTPASPTCLTIATHAALTGHPRPMPAS